MMAHPEKGETCSCFLQQFKNTVVLRRTVMHLISTIIESHNSDDATKDGNVMPKHVGDTIHH
jgi:hypothetical protein